MTQTTTCVMLFIQKVYICLFDVLLLKPFGRPWSSSDDENHACVYRRAL